MRELIENLSNLRGASGFEYRIADAVTQFFAPYADDVRRDALGNVIAFKSCGKKGAPSIMIEAHMDEIGLIVTSITKEGFLTFANLGGLDERILPSLEVTVHGSEDVWGTVAVKPRHMCEDKKTAKIHEMAIDTGLPPARVRELISIGDSVTIAQSVGAMAGSVHSGKTLDDRAGLAAVITAFAGISQASPNADVYAVAAVQEEVGCRGGKTAAYGVSPDMAIAVDVTHGLTPDNKENGFEIGSGAIIAKGPNLHPALTRRIIETAARYNIKTDIEIEGGDTGTDAWEIQTSRDGIPTALISIPLRYMHTAVETIDIADAEAVALLMEKFIVDLQEDMTWLYS